VTAPGPEGSSVDDIFGKADTSVAPPTQQAAPAKAPSKGAYDDLSDFEGLEDAKEGSADDDFANISRSGLDDFNPVFDNSPPPSQAKSESTAFGNESSFDFVSANSATGASAAGSGIQQKPADNDWDAIFSTLDSPSAAAAVPATNNDSGKTDSNSLSAPERPGIGRALTEEGHHDDPILKDLISMGYQRSAAVNALEKYDYNLERVSSADFSI
jgi:epidermal growth factor receptor substrate 15